MKKPTIPQKKTELLKHRTWSGMSIDTIGPLTNQYRDTIIDLWQVIQDLNNEGETTNDSSRVQGSGFRIQGSGLGIQGLGQWTVCETNFQSQLSTTF